MNSSKTQLLATVDMPPESKRGALIEQAEDDLEKEMEVLKEGTRQRNLEVQQKLVRDL